MKITVLCGITTSNRWARAMPTRLWYEGLRDTETWQITIPADLAPGRYAVYTGLYRLSDLERLPVGDADGKPLPDARVPLGSITISD